MSFFKILILIIATSLATKRLRLSGIRDDSKNVTVWPYESFAIELFGRNLPVDGYYFTTASRCEDHNSTDFGNHDTIYLNDVTTFGRNGYMTIKDGLSFDYDAQTYHLCCSNDCSSHSTFKYLSIAKKTSSKFDYWFPTVLCVYCVLMSAYSSGMTIGFMKISIAELERMREYEEPIKTRASRILRFRSHSNWLVCTFSMFSTIHSVVFTTKIEQFFEGMEYSYALSIVVSTVILFIFAEFVPQAFCNSKFGFVLASGLWPVTIFVFIICAPVAWPASKVIDYFLGRDVREVLTEEEKLNMIRNMAKQSNSKERKILERATQFSSKTVNDVMTPIDKVFLIPSMQRLNKSTILTLVEKGFTRIPIRDEKNRDNIFAVLNIKDLISHDLSNQPTVSRILSKTDKKSAEMKYVTSEMKVQQLMQQMRTGGFHIATVTRFMHNSYKVVGIITIEDILEQIFGDIEDETDKNTKSRTVSYQDTLVINWCREAGTDIRYPLSFCQQLLVIQILFQECPLLERIGLDPLQANQLLSTGKIRRARKGDNIFAKEALFIVWDGAVNVRYSKEVVVREVIIRPIDQKPEKEGKITNEMQAFIAGKGILERVFQKLEISHDEPLKDDNICEVVCSSETCSYFKIRVQDILDVVNESEVSLMKSDDMNTVTNAPEPPTNPLLKSVLNSENLVYGLLGPKRHPVTPSASRTPSPTNSHSAENHNQQSTVVDEKTKLLAEQKGSVGLNISSVTSDEPRKQ